MPFTSNGRGTLILRRRFEGVGNIRLASGTKDPTVLLAIQDHVDALHRRGDFTTLCQLRDGLIRPIDLMAGLSPGPRRRPQMEQSVYIVQADPSGNLKIGIARSPRNRLAEMQSGNWETLRILAVMPGGLDRERRLHQRFAAHRIAREWFRPAPEILALAADYEATV